MDQEAVLIWQFYNPFLIGYWSICKSTSVHWHNTTQIDYCYSMTSSWFCCSFVIIPRMQICDVCMCKARKETQMNGKNWKLQTTVACYLISKLILEILYVKLKFTKSRMLDMENPRFSNETEWRKFTHPSSQLSSLTRQTKAIWHVLFTIRVLCYFFQFMEGDEFLMRNMYYCIVYLLSLWILILN